MAGAPVDGEAVEFVDQVSSGDVALDQAAEAFTELGLVEQRYQAVREVLTDGASVTDVARRNGVRRQTVHEWLVKYANQGLVGLMDCSSKPLSCPHQMSPVVEARIIELRREHPGWDPGRWCTDSKSRALIPSPQGRRSIAVLFCVRVIGESCPLPAKEVTKNDD
jgi:transposase-like protein